MKELIYKSDALRAVLHNEGQAAVAAVEAIKPVDLYDTEKLLGYPMRDLLLFAEACRREQITESDLRSVVKDIEWGMRYCTREVERAWREAAESFSCGDDRIIVKAHIPPINLERYGYDVDEWLMGQIRKEQTDALD